jgi:hypothetical protein
MPTLAKAQLTESEPSWSEIWDEMYPWLCCNRGPILALLGFYTEHDLPVPEVNSVEEASRDEEAELVPIATALTLAAIASESMPPRILIATLKAISKRPSLFFSDRLPGGIEWIIACNYRRGEEKPGTHWRDVWGDGLGLEGEAEKPTDDNVTRAAISALRPFQGGRKRGRPPNLANRNLADSLGVVFRSSGHPITRRREPRMRGRKLVFVEAGPIYDFLNLVLQPLQRYLRKRDLPPVTVDTIVRFITEDFPQSLRFAR